jgi:hypothetical protein
MRAYGRNIFNVPIPSTRSIFFGVAFRYQGKFFTIILHGVTVHDEYLRLKKDATGNLGFTSYQKCITTIRMLAYRVVGDLVDEYIHIIKSTCLVSMHNIIVEDERDNVIYDQG